MRIGIATVLLLLGIQSAMAQKQLVSTVDFEEALVYYRPRIALAQAGDYAVSWEVLRKLETSEEWQIGFGRFTADGARFDASKYLSQTTPCEQYLHSQQVSSQQVNKPFNQRYQGFERGLRNVDMHFTADGLLLVTMEQFQLFREADDELHRQLSSVRVSVLDQRGQEFQPAADNTCEWRAFDPVDADLSSMPRIDVGFMDNVLLGTDGRRLNVMPTLNSAQEAWQYVTDHFLTKAPLPTILRTESRNWTDVATNGWFNVSGWQRCEATKSNSAYTEDNTVDDCDVEVQFFSSLSSSEANDITRKIKVNQDDAAGVINYRPAVAMNASGQSIIVWVDYRDSEHGDIFGQRFDTHGRPIGDNFKVSTGDGIIDGEEGSRPEVAMLDDGQFLVVWTEHHNHGMRAWGRYFEPSGKAKAEPFLLDPDPTLDSGFPDVAANGDQFAFTWLVDHENVTSIFVNIPGVTNTVERAVPMIDPYISLKGYPNPFTQQTTLEYSLKESGHVTLSIFDLLGREVKKLIDQPQGPGSYSIKLPANELATGYYFTRLQQGSRHGSLLLVRTE